MPEIRRVGRLLLIFVALAQLTACKPQSSSPGAPAPASSSVIPSPRPEVVDAPGRDPAPGETAPPAARATPVVPTPTFPPLIPATAAPTGTPLPAGVLPTADALRGVPSQGVITSTYVVRRGDTMGAIALSYGMSVDELKRMNGRRRDTVRIGETLAIKLQVTGSGPSVKLIPDSELVNGPGALDFDLDAAIKAQGGYLARFTEEVGGETLSGAEIVRRVSEQTSVHPRLLLAALEHAGGWISGPEPSGDQLNYPLGNRKTNFTGLYAQLSWAAARFNEGYYGWRLDNRYVVRFEDGDYGFLGDGINAGTAGVQNWLAAIGPRTTWSEAAALTEPRAFMTTYRRLFGDPWRFERGLPVPSGVAQPELSLPWSPGELWFFTGGPHSAWGRGTPWSALDFTTGKVAGCRRMSDWVTAMADGVITRSARGEVVQALDPSGDDRIGWSVLYLHIGADDRIPLGTRVHRGDRIGHPSCEGGISTGAHVHLVRRYNGEWINATGAIPFVMSGWTALEASAEYDGYLTRGSARREACECKQDQVNGIVH